MDADPSGLACRKRSSITYHGLVADGTRCTNRAEIFDVCVAGERKASIVLLVELKYIYISRLRMDRPVHILLSSMSQSFSLAGRLAGQSIGRWIDRSLNQ